MSGASLERNNQYSGVREWHEYLGGRAWLRGGLEAAVEGLEFEVCDGSFAGG